MRNDDAPAYCDLIMKGGITSGVIYPKLISGLAATYRFKNIGGTSAGAIAAGACAAAEFRRLRGGSEGFDRLHRLPDELAAEPLTGKGSMLRHLFQPSRRLSRHFDVLVASLNQPTKTAITLNALGTLLLRYWAPVAAVALVALLVVLALVRSSGPLPLWQAAAVACGGSAGWLALGWGFVWRHSRIHKRPALIARLVWVWVTSVAGLWGLLVAMNHNSQESSLVAALLSALAWSFVLPLALGLALGVCGWIFARSLLTGMQANFWGICTGLTTYGAARVDGLTAWLTRYFNEVAGLMPDERPLTLGDLWSGSRSSGDDSSEADDTPALDRNVNLEVMTTAVSRHMPYTLPFRPGAGAYFFDPEEWKLLFPASVMDWLLAASPPIPSGGGARTVDGRELRKLPCNKNLPVVLLVRMSLSFPVLLSAIPLYAFDYSGQTQRAHPKKVWFSDGGIASNMPLHFFDAPLPGHPTFAVNLKDEHPDHRIVAGDVGSRVYLPDNNSAGLQKYWKELDDASPLGLFGLLWTMVTTMQNWHDEIQLPMPGYRDRVVQISQKPDEGGLNLDMPSANIKALSDAGACAAERLIERFSAPNSEGWQNHRQIRMKTFAALGEMLGRHPAVHDPTWRVLAFDPALGYSAAERQMAERVLNKLADIGQVVRNESTLVLLDKAPRPRPVWRIVPRI